MMLASQLVNGVFYVEDMIGKGHAYFQGPGAVHMASVLSLFLIVVNIGDRNIRIFIRV
jgi:hypothetical protein